MFKAELPTPPHSFCPAPTILYDAPHKPSKPIEIPTRPRHLLSPTFSPLNRPLSPELIFEMSPINSTSTDSLSPSDYNFYPFVHRSLKNRTSTSTSTSKTPPFMYPFPRPPAHHKRQVKPNHLAVPQSPKSFPSSAIPFSCSLHRKRSCQESLSIDCPPPQQYCLTSAFESDLENSFPEYQPQIGSFSAPTSPLSRGRTRGRSSMCNHVPAMHSPTSIPIHSQRVVLTSRSPKSPRPLLLHSSGRGLTLDDISSEEEEPALEKEITSFGFENYLMRRTEDEKRVRGREAEGHFFCP